MRIILKILAFAFLQFAAFAAFMSGNAAFVATSGEKGMIGSWIGFILGLLSFWVLFKPRKQRNRV